jgi:hypothetical protein
MEAQVKNPNNLPPKSERMSERKAMFFKVRKL